MKNRQISLKNIYIIDKNVEWVYYYNRQGGRVYE